MPLRSQSDQTLDKSNPPAPQGHPRVTTRYTHPRIGGSGFSERLAEVGIAGSIGSTGDSYDNALAESINGLYKTELIKPRKPWKSLDEVEIATAEWVDWFNHHRLYEYRDDIPPAELEEAYYHRSTAQRPAGLTV